LPKPWPPHVQALVSTTFGPHNPLEPDRLSVTRTELGRVAAAIRQAHKLAAYPEGHFRLEYHADMLSTPLPHLQDAIRVGRLLLYDALVRLEDHDADGAAESLLGLFHLLHYLKDEPITLSQLTRCALTTLGLNALERVVSAKTGPTEKHLVALQQLFEQDGAEDWARQVFRDERAGYHYLLTNAANGDAALPGGARVSPEQHAWYLRYLTRLMAASLLPREPQDAAFGGLRQDLDAAAPAVKSFVPDFNKISGVCRKANGRVRCAAVAIAAERYRRKAGHWPTRAGDLVPAYLRALPQDVLQNEPVRWGTAPEGFAVYCFFGGNLAAQFELMNEPTGASNQGIRLLNPERRH
jgi:hypothetical protein